MASKPNFSIKYNYPKQIFLPHKKQSAMPSTMNFLPQGGSRNAGYITVQQGIQEPARQRCPHLQAGPEGV